MDHRDRDTAQIETRAGHHPTPAGADGVGRQAHDVERTIPRDRDPFPDLTRREVLQHRPHTADVIRVAMGDHCNIEPPHAQRPQRRSHHA